MKFLTVDERHFEISSKMPLLKLFQRPHIEERLGVFGSNPIRGLSSDFRDLFWMTRSRFHLFDAAER